MLIGPLDTTKSNSCADLRTLKVKVLIRPRHTSKFSSSVNAQTERTRGRRNSGGSQPIKHKGKRLLARIAKEAHDLHRSTLLVREIEKRRPPAILLGDELLENVPNLVVPRPVPPAKPIGATDRRGRQKVGHSVLHARGSVHETQAVRPVGSVARPAAKRLLDEGERVTQRGQDRPREGPPDPAKTAPRTESVGRVQREEAKGRERPIQQGAPIVPHCTLTTAPR